MYEAHECFAEIPQQDHQSFLRMPSTPFIPINFFNTFLIELSEMTPATLALMTAGPPDWATKQFPISSSAMTYKNESAKRNAPAPSWQSQNQGGEANCSKLIDSQDRRRGIFLRFRYLSAHLFARFTK